MPMPDWKTILKASVANKRPFPWEMTKVTMPFRDLDEKCSDILFWKNAEGKLEQTDSAKTFGVYVERVPNKNGMRQVDYLMKFLIEEPRVGRPPLERTLGRISLSWLSEQQSKLDILTASNDDQNLRLFIEAFCMNLLATVDWNDEQASQELEAIYSVQPPIAPEAPVTQDTTQARVHPIAWSGEKQTKLSMPFTRVVIFEIEKTAIMIWDTLRAQLSPNTIFALRNETGQLEAGVIESYDFHPSDPRFTKGHLVLKAFRYLGLTNGIIIEDSDKVQAVVLSAHLHAINLACCTLHLYCMTSDDDTLSLLDLLAEKITPLSSKLVYDSGVNKAGFRIPLPEQPDNTPVAQEQKTDKIEKRKTNPGVTAHADAIQRLLDGQTREANYYQWMKEYQEERGALTQRNTSADELYRKNVWKPYRKKLTGKI